MSEGWTTAKGLWIRGPLLFWPLCTCGGGKGGGPPDEKSRDGSNGPQPHEGTAGYAGQSCAHELWSPTAQL